MDPAYQLLVHFERGVDGVRVLRELVREWAVSTRLPLRSFGKEGEASPDPSWLCERLEFRGGRDDSALSLRTGRGRKGVDVVDCMFTNPDVELPYAPNFVSVRFHHDRIREQSEGYSLGDMAKLLGAVADSGPVLSGYVDCYANVRAGPIMHNERAFSAAVRSAGGRSPGWAPILWLSVLPSTVMKALGQGSDSLARSGLIRLRDLADGGVVVATHEESPRGNREEVNRVQTSMRALGWL